MPLVQWRLRMCRLLELVWMLARGAACLASQPSGAEQIDSLLQQLWRDLRAAAALLGSCIEQDLATGQSTVSLQVDPSSEQGLVDIGFGAFQRLALAVESLPAPAQPRIAAVAAGPVTHAVEAAARLAGKLFQAGGQNLPAAVAAARFLPLGGEAVRLLASLAAAAPAAEARAAWLPQLQLLRTAGKLCHLAAADICAAAAGRQQQSSTLALVPGAAALAEVAAVSAAGPLSRHVLPASEAAGRLDG